MCWNILWRDALVIFRGFNYTSAFFFFLQCETNPVDKLHSKDLVVVTLKNRKKKKRKKKKEEKCKKFYPENGACVTFKFDAFLILRASVMYSPSPLTSPSSIIVAVAFFYRASPFFFFVSFLSFSFPTKPSIGKRLIQRIGIVRAGNR